MLFELDDVEAAYPELDARFDVGEGAVLGGPVNRFVQGFAKRDSSGCAAWSCNTRQQRSQHLRVERFDQMVVEAGLRASSAIFLLTEARGRD